MIIDSQVSIPTRTKGGTRGVLLIIKRQVWDSLRYPFIIGTTVPILPYSWILYGYSVLLLAAGGSSSYVLRSRYRTTVCVDKVDYYWTTNDVLAYDVLTVSIL